MADTNLTKQGKAKGKAGRFMRETKAELKKVTWPSKDQLIHNTGIILVFIVLVTVILSVLDVAFAKLFQLLTNLL